ncbi:MAG: DinB family protein [Terriglobales bacterium]
MTTLIAHLSRPEPAEYDPYYERYISLVKGDEIVTTLKTQTQDTRALLSPLSSQQAERRYAPGKWSVKEVLGHMNDTERILSYRALRIGRGDKTPIEGFEQDDYVPNGRFDRRTLEDLLDEFITIRAATVQLFSHFDAAAAERHGTANQKQISARALAYIIAGHELHHRRILEEKYLK